MKTIFTTGQVAKICKVAPRTVSKWFDSGRLRGYRIPGSQDRRIPRKHAEYLETVLVGLLSDEDNSSGFDRSVFNETFRKPFDVALLAERIRTLVGRRKQLA